VNALPIKALGLLIKLLANNDGRIEPGLIKSHLEKQGVPTTLNETLHENALLILYRVPLMAASQLRVDSSGISVPPRAVMIRLQ
jgi:hypothetical protein